MVLAVSPKDLAVLVGMAILGATARTTIDLTAVDTVIEIADLEISLEAIASL